MYPLKMRPAFKDYLWGGNRLATMLGKESTAEIIAESWEISCHPNGVSTVDNGQFSGTPLDELLRRCPELCGEYAGKPFPMLIKLIDAKQKLSLQVHPDGENSKNEMWYILDAAPDAEIIAGLKRQVTRVEFLTALQDGTFPELVKHIRVKAGDCICVPAGLIHGIGGGILLAEVQQSSDVTYRIYDYGRLDANGNPRPLHIQEAADSLDFSAEPVITTYKKGQGYSPLTSWPYFSSGILNVNGNVKMPPEKNFCAMVVTAGRVVVSAGGERVPLNLGESLFMPAGTPYSLEGGADILVSTME